MSDEHTVDPYDVPAPVTTPEPQAPALTAAEARFVTCRWRKPADAGLPAHCTHRDVVPMAGATGFSADSWCSDCVYYKVKRVVRRPPRFD
jgi:hypothetical protein